MTHRVEGVFAALSQGDVQPTLRGVSPQVVHVFLGEHPLGGRRTSSEGLRAWFDRLRRLFPELRFTTQRVIVHGWPWDTWVVVEWTAEVRPAAGPAYVNTGVHLINIRRGKVVAIRAYEDSQKVAEACQRMAELGIAEASVSPIEG